MLCSQLVSPQVAPPSIAGVMKKKFKLIFISFLVVINIIIIFAYGDGLPDISHHESELPNVIL